jgi:hypothetical protein
MWPCKPYYCTKEVPWACKPYYCTKERPVTMQTLLLHKRGPMTISGIGFVDTLYNCEEGGLMTIHALLPCTMGQHL